MTKTLEIIDTFDNPNLPHFSIPGNKVYHTYYQRLHQITMYTKRPDGTWYRLTIDLYYRGPYRTLLKMLREGLEPYLVFEIVAL